MSSLRVALAGCGRMGCFTSDRFRELTAPGWLPLSHAESIQNIEGLELCALCDPSSEALEQAGETYGVNARYGDVQEMILQEKPDILAVATRTPERPSIVRFAAENGVKAVHIEKPLAQSLGECLDTVEALDRNKVLISYGTYRRYHGVYRQVLELVENGSIGELQEISLEMGRGMLFWTHPHSVDLMLMFSKGRNPELVWADCQYDEGNFQGQVLDEDPVVRHGYVRFSGGLTGSILQSGGLNLRLGGSAGNVVLHGDGTDATLHLPTEDATGFAQRKEYPAFTGMSGTMRALTELRDGLESGAATCFDLNDLEMNTRLLLCMGYSTCNGGVPVEPNTLPPEFTITGRFGNCYA